MGCRAGDIVLAARASCNTASQSTGAQIVAAESTDCSAPSSRRCRRGYFLALLCASYASSQCSVCVSPAFAANRGTSSVPSGRPTRSIWFDPCPLCTLSRYSATKNRGIAPEGLQPRFRDCRAISARGSNPIFL
jgi:hypothetical protein